ncbi:MAG: hypothetical protein AB7I33_13660 [Gemmatimonadales bacterium]
MGNWSRGRDPGDEWEPREDSSGQPLTAVATNGPVLLRVAPAPDPATPEGLVCMVTRAGPCVVTRSYVEPDVPKILVARGFFSRPVRLALVVQEEDGNIQGRVFALIPFAGQDDQTWADSLDRFEEGADLLEPHTDTSYMRIPLGSAFRPAEERHFPWDLELEARDLLVHTLGQGRAVPEAVEKLIAGRGDR